MGAPLNICFILFLGLFCYSSNRNEMKCIISKKFDCLIITVHVIRLGARRTDGQRRKICIFKLFNKNVEHVLHACYLITIIMQIICIISCLMNCNLTLYCYFYLIATVYCAMFLA